jgi:hypothetical protein
MLFRPLELAHRNAEVLLSTQALWISLLKLQLTFCACFPRLPGGFHIL